LFVGASSLAPNVESIISIIIIEKSRLYRRPTTSWKGVVPKIWIKHICNI
jgi:hypothetical protein